MSTRGAGNGPRKAGAARARPAGAARPMPGPSLTPKAAGPARPKGAASSRPQAASSARSRRLARKASTPTAGAGPERLHKLMAAAGIASRRKAEDLIAAGRVKIDGRIVREPGVAVDPRRQKVRIDGQDVELTPRPFVYLLLNKPDAVVSSAELDVDERGRPTVRSLIRGMNERLVPVGRLDYHSRGLIILTNDGAFAAKLTHPRSGVVKIYHVKFQGHPSDEAMDALRKGVVLDDGVRTLPATELSIVKRTRTNVWLQVGLRQGLNRQLRRMGDAIGHPVLKLIRVAIGDIDIGELEEGQYRPLSSSEVARLTSPDAERLDARSREHAKPRRSAQSAGEGAHGVDPAGTTPTDPPAARPRRQPASPQPEADAERPTTGRRSAPRAASASVGSGQARARAGSGASAGAAARSRGENPGPPRGAGARTKGTGTRPSRADGGDRPSRTHKRRS